MPVDTPATIAVLGAGPVGLEAALYARFLGYDVLLAERGRVGENLLRFGQVRLFSPFRLNRSPLGLAALAAQDPAWRPPEDEALLTAREFVDRYLRPLAETDLLADSVQEHTEVLAIGRDGPLKGDLVGDPRRAESKFRLLLRDAGRGERVALADAVIDATGTYGNHNHLGAGGVPAVGERDAEADIEYALPDILGADRQRYAGRHVLLVGAGYSAATNVVALAALAEEAPGTRVTWLTRGAGDVGPIARIAGDRLPERDRIARAANALAAGGERVKHLRGTTVERLQRGESGWQVTLAGNQAGEIDVDCIIANVGFRPDATIFEELQVHQCYATGGPMKLAAALFGQASADCLDQTSPGAETLATSEPNFYVLGAKSYGRNSKFLITLGLEQVRDVFRLIVGREGLDLYATVQPAGRSGGART